MTTPLTIARRAANVSGVPTWAEVDMNDDATVATCPECGRRIGVVTPAHSNGTARRFLTHGPRVDRCPGSGSTTW